MQRKMFLGMLIPTLFLANAVNAQSAVPSQGELVYQRAMDRMLKGDRAGANEDLLYLVERNPRSAQLKSAAGMNLYTSGLDKPKGLKLLQEARDLYAAQGKSEDYQRLITTITELKKLK